MKTLLLGMLVLITSLLMMACSTAPREMDEKYVFPELEQVDRIRSYEIDGWANIDDQSLFVSVSPKTSYLIILKKPSIDLKHAYGIKFDSSSSSVYAKFDSIKLVNLGGGLDPSPVYIDRIYKIKSKEQKKIIRAKILGKDSDTIENASEDGSDF